MNYRYRMTDIDYVITEQEHKYCLEQYKKGKNIIPLRDETLGINMAMLKSWNTTSDAIDERRRQPRLDEPAPQPKLRSALVDPVSIAQGQHEFRTKMGWEHPDYCWCKTQKS